MYSVVAGLHTSILEQSAPDTFSHDAEVVVLNANIGMTTKKKKGRRAGREKWCRCFVSQKKKKEHTNIVEL